MAQTENTAKTAFTVVRHETSGKLFFYFDPLDTPLALKSEDAIIARIEVDLSDKNEMDWGSVTLEQRFQALLGLNNVMEDAVRETLLRVAEAAFSAGKELTSSHARKAA